MSTILSELHEKRLGAASRSRGLALSLHREALATAGERIAGAQGVLDFELARVATRIESALKAGMTVSEIAELTNLTRQKVYDLRNRSKGRTEDLEMRSLALLGACGALPVARLADQMGIVEDAVTAAVRDLLSEGLVKPLMSVYEGGTQETIFKLTPTGEEQVERWLLHAEREPARISVYVAIDPTERAALSAAAEQVFGPEFFALIEPGTVTGQRTPEFSFNVVAENERQAVDQARIRMAELRQLAGLKARETVVTALAPDNGPLHLTFGSRRSWLIDGFGPA